MASVIYRALGAGALLLAGAVPPASAADLHHGAGPGYHRPYAGPVRAPLPFARHPARGFVAVRPAVVLAPSLDVAYVAHPVGVVHGGPYPYGAPLYNRPPCPCE